jgi:hypothetical protein
MLFFQLQIAWCISPDFFFIRAIVVFYDLYNPPGVLNKEIEAAA